MIISEYLSDANIRSTPTNSDSSDLDENDDEFFNELFTDGVTPSYVAAETAPWLDDSDSELSTGTAVKFYIDKSMAVAEISGTKHRIGFLDLNDEEYSCLGAISETSVELSVNEKYILMKNKKFNIKRIHECENPIDAHQKQMESLYEELGLQRIKFSSSEPFLAKYQNDIYFVGKKLCTEYLVLLNRSKQPPGTPIRINKKRLNIDKTSQMLDVKQSIDFKKPNEIVIISDTIEPFATASSDDRSVNDYRRFVMTQNTWTLLEVEANLIHSSVYDVCTEIYAEIDYPISKAKAKATDDIQPQTEKLSRKEERKLQRAVKREEKQKQNDSEKRYVPLNKCGY